MESPHAICLCTPCWYSREALTQEFSLSSWLPNLLGCSQLPWRFCHMVLAWCATPPSSGTSEYYRSHAQWLSCVLLFATPWIVASRAPLSMGFSRQEYWSGLPFPSLGDLSNSGIEPVCPALAGGFFTTEPSGKPLVSVMLLLLLLSHFSRVRLCAAPETAAHQAPLSLGFSRKEHWSGLPFPSPMHESGKWKWSRSVVFDS